MCVCGGGGGWGGDKMKILIKKKKKKKIVFLRLGIFFSNWEKSHLNPIGKGAEHRPLRTPKKIPAQCKIIDLSSLGRIVVD